MRKEKSLILKRLTISALFLAFALLVRTVSAFYIPIFGANGLRVSFSGIFTVFPAILFGPVYGMAVGGLTDFLGWVLKPEGTYIPWLTLSAMLAGFLEGLLWKAIKSKKDKRLKVIVLCIFITIGIIGAYNHISINCDNIVNGFYATEAITVNKATAIVLQNNDNLSPASFIIVSLAQYAKAPAFQAKLALYCNLMTIGFEVLSLFGILLLLFDTIIKKVKKFSDENSFFKLLLVMLIAGIIETTINTEVLKIFIPVLVDRAFLLLWIPRLTEEIIVVSIQAYIVSILYMIYQKRISNETNK